MYTAVNGNAQKLMLSTCMYSKQSVLKIFVVIYIHKMSTCIDYYNCFVSLLPLITILVVVQLQCKWDQYFIGHQEST